jgi:hypothetical protein
MRFFFFFTATKIFHFEALLFKPSHLDAILRIKT